MKLRGTLSLKAKLALSASAAILIGSILIIAVGFYSSTHQRISQLSGEITAQVQTFNHYIEDWIQVRGQTLSAIPSTVPESQLLPTLRQARDSSGLANVFMAYPDGSQVNAGEVTLAPDNNDPRVWEWYKVASANPGELFLSSPSVASASKKVVVSFGLAKQVNGQQVVFGADMNLSQLISLLQQAKLPGDGRVLIATKDGNIFADQDSSHLNQPVSILGSELTAAKLTQLASNTQLQQMNINGKDTYVYAVPIAHSRLVTLVMIDHDSIVAPIHQSLINQSLICLVIVILCVLLFWFYNNRLFRSLDKVTTALQSIAQGGGDLTQQINVDSQDEVGLLATSFNQFNETMRNLIVDLRQEIETLREKSHASNERSQQMASRISQQQQDVTSVATAIEEMSTATSEIAGHTQQTLDSVKESNDLTVQGDELIQENRASVESLADSMAEAGTVVGELQQHAQSINDIMSTIQGIAEQTNLLALNAAIEAARAGEHGRGFAVVADEVRTLSQRTHQATEEIQHTIGTLVGNISDVVDLMENSSNKVTVSVEQATKASDALHQIKTSVEMIHDMNTQVATAAEEQSQVSQEITMNSSRIKDMGEELLTDTEATGQYAQDIDQQVDLLIAKIESFKVA